MRFVTIEPRYRTAFNAQWPADIDEDLIRRELRVNFVRPIELTPDVDLWIADEPQPGSFRFFSDGVVYFGAGLMCGRTKLGDFKSLPRRFQIESICGWLQFPDQRVEPRDRRRIEVRPTRFPQPAAAPYHRIAPHGAADVPYITQMYG